MGHVPGTFALRTRDVGSGSSALGRCRLNVWITPETDRLTDISGRLKSARSRLMQCSKKHFYSITSSARASSVGGMSRPRPFAVLRLITNSNLVGCSTGRSAGLAPRRILST